MTHALPIHPEAGSGAAPRVPAPSRRERVPTGFLIGMAALPTAVWFVKRLNDGSDEPLGLLVLGLALFLMWRDRVSLVSDARSHLASAFVLTVSVLSIGTLPPLIRGAMTLTGIAIWFGIHRKPGLLGLMILSLPVVASLQFYAGYPLRIAAAEGAVRLMELGGIVVQRNGAVLTIGGSSVGVDPACSGVRMLWHAMVAAMALAALHRITWRATIIAGIMAFLLVIPANTLRATWLALVESGKLSVAGPTHGSLGLISFLIVLIPLWLAISTRARALVAAEDMGNIKRPGKLVRGLLGLAAILAPLLMMNGSWRQRPVEPLKAVHEFTFNGVTLPLHPQAPSPEESAFAASFPGSLASYRWGTQQVILRRVNQATRKLHPSADCLRAAGYETSHSVTVEASDGSQWSKFQANRDGERLIVHERIVSTQDGSTWTDVPAWFWSALRHPLNGPWQAETVISR